jgi:ribosomal protein S18 acetylase RimI-like enzyme
MTPTAENDLPRVIRFRRATRADVERIVSLTDAAYRGEGLGGWTTEAHLVGVRRTDAEVVEELLAALESMIMLVEIGHDFVGCVELTKRGSYAVLGMLAVRPELQNQGIGKAIICEAERICLDEYGAKEIRMHVLRMRSDIIAWYERRGYQPNGERAPFPYGDERVGVPIRDDLEFVVLVKALQ